MSSKENVDLEIKAAAQLSLIEITIGSIGHGFKIPLTGQILSLNQLAFLLNSMNKDQLPASSAFEISGIAAVLKSFSVAGQKLGPMLSIVMQGFLFWLFNAIFKKKLLGQILGGVFLSLWSFAQPLLTYFLIYGFEFFKLIEYYEKKLRQDFSFIHHSLLIAISFILILKIAIALFLVIYSYRTKNKIEIFNKTYLEKISQNSMPVKSNSKTWISAFKDLTRPLFVISFLLMIIFIWQYETSASEKIWLSLRPLASAYIIFYLLRSPKISTWLLKLSQKSESFHRIYMKSKKALDLVAQWSTRSSEISSRRKLE